VFALRVTNPCLQTFHCKLDALLSTAGNARSRRTSIPTDASRSGSFRTTVRFNFHLFGDQSRRQGAGEEPAVVSLIVALPPRQPMLDDPAPVLAFRQPLDLLDRKSPSGFLRWSKPKPRRTHFRADGSANRRLDCL
jgi:hypothetical protein